jgi:hypothetical protein
MPSSGMFHRVALLRTEISEYRIAPHHLSGIIIWLGITVCAKAIQNYIPKDGILQFIAVHILTN